MNKKEERGELGYYLRTFKYFLHDPSQPSRSITRSLISIHTPLRNSSDRPIRKLQNNLIQAE
jgi:hypothetical protein